MNRRDALKAALGAAAIPGMTAEIVEAQKPLMVVLKSPARLRKGAVMAMSENMRHLLSKTDYPDMPFAILQGGMELEVIEDPRGNA